jgi:integrase
MEPVRLARELAGRGLAPKTIRDYMGAVDRAQRWLAQHDADLKTAPADLLAGYIDSLPVSRSSGGLARNAILHYWRACRRRNPPVQVLRVPRHPRPVCRALHPDDARRLSDAAEKWEGREGLAVLLGLYLALRRAEIARLRWTDFDDGWVTVHGKGDVIADLPVHPKVEARLRVHPYEGRHLFVGRFGSHVHPTTVWTWIRKVGEWAGVDVSTHELRHTSLATANDATRDLRAVQEYARHARPETTASYTRATAERLQAVSDSIVF